MFKNKHLVGIFVLFLFTCFLSPADSACADKKAVIEVVEQLFSLLEKPDPVLAEKILVLGSMSFSTEKLEDGSTQVTRQYLQCQVQELMKKKVKLKETMCFPEVRIDGDLAVLWAPYKLYVDGECDHYGTNAVSLIKKDGKWKIATIVYNKIKK